MALRKQQQELKDLVDKIQSGESEVNEIFLAWGVGSGKSLSPVILSDLLINNRKQVVIVPRNSLKTQGEVEYTNDIYPVDKIARIADNCGDPFRGCDSCFTSYQGISANPELWIKVFEENECMLVLDEFHHLSEGGDWIKIIKEMQKLSFLTAYLSGTIFRGDNTKIPFVPYDDNYNIDYRNTDKKKWIIYSSEDALRDGAVLPFESLTVNGSGTYIDQSGIERSFNKFTGDSNQLRCSFKSEYSQHMLDLSINHWLKYKKLHPWSKILIVSPDIATAKEYTEYIQKKYPFIKSAIATSEDSTECKSNIKRLKQENHTFKSLDCLINVGICYEGLNVVQASHIVALTLIRSLPWLIQMTGRVIRRYKEKDTGYVFCPADPKMIKAIKDMAGGIIKSADGEPVEKQEPDPNKEPSEGGGGNGGIEALSSRAHLEELEEFREFLQAKQEPKKQESQSEKEHRLRKEINSVINKIVGTESAGNRKVKERIFWLKAKQLVNKGRGDDGKLIRKPLKEMTVKELQKVADFSKNYK